MLENAKDMLVSTNPDPPSWLNRVTTKRPEIPTTDDLSVARPALPDLSDTAQARFPTRA